MKKIFLLFFMLSGNAFAVENLNIVPELSSISFATIKKQYVIEPAMVENIQGKYSNGRFDLSIDFNNIETNIPVRNSRINQLFLKTNLYPLVKVSGQFNQKLLVKPITQTTIKAKVEFYGQVKNFEIPVIIHKAGELMTVNSYKPVIVKASDFNIPADNLKNLSATVGGISISDSIPLNINLTFKALIKTTIEE